MKVVLAGGGTGGHIFPALAVADELARLGRDVETVFVGRRRGMERAIFSRSGSQYFGIPARGFVGKGAFEKGVVFPLTLFWGLVQSILVLREVRPHSVVGTGGYVALPVVLAALLLGLPTLIQEQNSIPGMTTRLLAYFADEVHISFPRTSRLLRAKGRVVLSGNPVRRFDIVKSPAEARRSFGLDGQRRTVLLLGGSQGAHSLNRAFVDALPHLAALSDVQFLVQTGPRDVDLVQGAVRETRLSVVVREFIEEMAAAYRSADLVIARAGATTMAELLAVGAPAVLVPFPHSAGGHQEYNAREAERVGAAKAIPDSELSGERLAQVVAGLLEDEHERALMGDRARKLGRSDAARSVAIALLRLADRGLRQEAGRSTRT
ncbi:hypothetical protein AMJ71_05385 [candidate division TA06 bacterium SM1_40]|uniref:UDP-N-acetylglucosamine--N-acetylmuramyl-(pentapeptide) pyrophosphoryl-undecaprenol N-acetylglucosamine transferase n=1 Tax=candidate division TA06 bacterium SM1_40 TaxID=1703773 RepID=A0A0S8JM38_UNCT6|nr:MAG: hypothetical protein AMJ71_05385 [candidate division TA06 bacterium SM1_40]